MPRSAEPRSASMISIRELGSLDLGIIRRRSYSARSASTGLTRRAEGGQPAGEPANIGEHEGGAA
jgi:hypothetical protein